MLLDKNVQTGNESTQMQVRVPRYVQVAWAMGGGGAGGGGAENVTVQCSIALVSFPDRSGNETSNRST